MKKPLVSPQRIQPKHMNSSGFTLVEVIIVIAIISILMAAGVTGLKNLAAGKGTSSAITSCEALFNEARTIAISKRCKARVMVDIDDNDTDNYLRRVVIAHQKINADGTIEEDEWVLASRAYTMPSATYFSRVYSTLSDDTAIPTEEMTGDNFSTSYQGEYAFYEFNGEGIFLNSGASFIIGGGIRPKGQEPRFIRDAEKDLAGFVIWKNGRTSTYRNPEHMGIDASADNF